MLKLSQRWTLGKRSKNGVSSPAAFVVLLAGRWRNLVVKALCSYHPVCRPAVNQGDVIEQRPPKLAVSPRVTAAATERRWGRDHPFWKPLCPRVTASSTSTTTAFALLGPTPKLIFFFSPLTVQASACHVSLTTTLLLLHNFYKILSLRPRVAASSSGRPWVRRNFDDSVNLI